MCLKLHTDVFQDCVRNVNTFGKALLFLLEVDFDYKYVCPSLEACFKPITNVSKNQLIKGKLFYYYNNIYLLKKLTNLFQLMQMI